MRHSLRLTHALLAVLPTFVACGGAVPATESSESSGSDERGAASSSAPSFSLPAASHGASSTGSSGGAASLATAGSAVRDAGVPPDAATGATGPVLALDEAPTDTWTWIPVPESKCGNGSPTGIGWNPHAGASHLLIYLQGGGACYDAESCWGAAPTASNMTGYGATDFASDPTLLASIFERSNTGNPYHDANLVFVPYCTGDLHIGTAMVSYSVSGVATPTYFNGANNVDTFVATLTAAAQAKTLSRVFLSGVSAGGFGSFLNQDAVARPFGIRTDVIDDSGPAITGTGIPGDWSARLPPACTTCVDANSVFLYMRKTYPESRYGLLTFQTDTVLPLFFGETDQAFATLIQQFVSSLSSDPNAKAFVDTSSGHVVLEETDPVATPYILPWLTQMATDDPAWATVQH
jgi:hypothetical protein